MALSSSSNELSTFNSNKSVVSTIDYRSIWNQNASADDSSCSSEFDVLTQLTNCKLDDDTHGLLTLPSQLHDIKEEVVHETPGSEQGEQVHADYNCSRIKDAVALKACSYELCAAPWDICEVLHNAANHPSETFSPNFHVQCSNNACNFAGHLHPSCLQRWIALCHLQCQLLGRRTAAFSDSTPPAAQEFADDTAVSGEKETSMTLLLTGLFQLYKCPVCCQPSLCRVFSSLDSTDLAPHQLLNDSSTKPPKVISMTLSDPLANVIIAVQYVKQYLTRESPTSPQAIQTHPDLCDYNRLPSSLPSQQRILNEPGTWKPQEHQDERRPVNWQTDGSGEVVSMVNSAPPLCADAETGSFNFDMELMGGRKASLPNVSPGCSGTKPSELARHTAQAMHKPTMYSKSRTRLYSSNSTSGFVSGSSMSSDLDASLEGSRRTSLNFFNESTCNNWLGNQEYSNQCLYLQFNDLALPFPSGSGGVTNGSAGSIETKSVFAQPSSWSTNEFDETALPNPDNNFMKQPLWYLNIPPGMGGRVDDGTVDNSVDRSHVNRAARARCQLEERRAPTAPYSTASNKGKEARHGTTAGGRRRFLAVNRKGNIFLQRPEFNVFEKLPAHKRNAYFICLDDDCCTGNEDTRAFLLAQLTNNNISEVACLSCLATLPVYDHFPIVDGVFFLSPVCHLPDGAADGIQVHWHSHGFLYQSNSTASSGSLGANSEPLDMDGAAAALTKRLFGDQPKPIVPPPGCLGPRQQLTTSGCEDSGGGSNKRSGFTRFGGRQDRYLHALCMACMHEVSTPAPGSPGATGKIQCRVCCRPWSGATLLVGGLYTYDIFAATPCCVAHLTCNSCGNQLHDKSLGDNGNLPDRTTSTSTTSSQHRRGTALSEPPAALPLPFFSQYSQLITCPCCGKVDYHFVKPFHKYYRSSACRQTAS